MTGKLLILFSSAILFSRILPAQGIDTHARPTDWEEINFEFNQAVLADGFPSLLRLADLLKQHQDYKVTITGNADQVGSNRFNDALSLRRANVVSNFLQHYGATPAQIQVRGDGKKNPEEPGRGVNARFVNRRVTVIVTAPDGTQIGDGDMASAIREFETYSRAQLGKIDAILTQLRDLESQVRALQGDTGTIKTDTASIRQDTGAIRQDTGAIHTDTKELVSRPVPLTADQTTTIARTEATRAADYALAQSALRNRKYGLIGYDEGPTFANGSIHGTGKTGNYSADVFGSALIPFGNGRLPEDPGTHGLQIDGDWTYFHKNAARRDGLSDGIFDIGLVNRFDSVQLGAFAQFDYVNFNAYQGGGVLGNGVLTLDYIFPNVSIGVFGSKGFREYANVGSTNTGGGLTPFYLRGEDQAGIHTSVALGPKFQLDTSTAFKKRYVGNNYPSVSLKLSYLFSPDLALFSEIDENTTYQNVRIGDRIVFGIQFGNFLRPKDYKSTQGVIPVSVPRPHYELLSR